MGMPPTSLAYLENPVALGKLSEDVFPSIVIKKFIQDAGVVGYPGRLKTPSTNRFLRFVLPPEPPLADSQELLLDSYTLEPLKALGAVKTLEP